MNIIIIYFFSVLLYCAMCPSEMTTKRSLMTKYHGTTMVYHGKQWYTMAQKKQYIYAGDVRTTIDQGIVRLIQYLV